MEAIESQINNLRTLQRDLDASLREGLYDEEGKLKPMELIGTAQRELRRQAQEEMDTLSRRVATLVDEYNTKTSIIGQAMQFKAMDYEAAVADYNMRFNQQVQLINMMENRFTREDQEANRIRDDARANLSIVTQMMADSGKLWGDLDPNMQAMISTLELKSGLPTGVIQAFMNEKPEMGVDYVTTGYDAAGNQVVSFFSYNNGDPQLLKTVGTGAVAAAGIGAGEEGAAATMEAILISKRGEDGYVSPDDYKEGKATWFASGKYSKEDYDNLFSRFVNPTHAGDYGIETKLEEAGELSVADSVQQLKDNMNFSRKEAKEYVMAQLEKQYGAGKVPKTIKDALEDALVITYGRTFWQRVLPGGR